MGDVLRNVPKLLKKIVRNTQCEQIGNVGQTGLNENIKENLDITWRLAVIYR